MNTPTLDESIPLLTEIIAPAPKSINFEVELPLFLTAKPTPANDGTVTLSSPELSKEQLQRLEIEVSERVLHNLFGQIDLMLEQRVRDSLADVLQTAVDGLAQQIKQGLQQTMGEVVSRAVSQEIAKINSTNL